jgi:hypothetical protein
MAIAIRFDDVFRIILFTSIIPTTVPTGRPTKVMKNQKWKMSRSQEPNVVSHRTLVEDSTTSKKYRITPNRKAQMLPETHRATNPRNDFTTAFILHLITYLYPVGKRGTDPNY